MDVLTHALVGAALAQAVAPRREVRLAAAVGFAAGLLPDADALLGGSDDPLLVIEYHRHFTHALAFAPLGALVAALLAWPLLRRQLRFGRIYLYALPAYAAGGLLDACTSYGTYLWWPFTDARTAWNLIAIVDPFFSLALLAGLIAALARRRAGAARAGLAVAALYLALGAVQHHRADGLARQLAARRGHVPAELVVKPTIGNVVLWRAVYVAGGRAWADGLRPALRGPARIYPGTSAELFDVERDLPWAPGDSPARRDAERFVALSEGMVARHPTRPELLGDVRYAMLPTSVAPLWGIVLDPTDPERGAAFVTDRSLTAEDRRRFLAMLLGRPDD